MDSFFPDGHAFILLLFYTTVPQCPINLWYIKNVFYKKSILTTFCRIFIIYFAVFLLYLNDSLLLVCFGISAKDAILL